ncbi:lipid A biosynthesis lauroyl acyltransferase [Limoniibacter endophyticus]|uniref:Lauroyl acyltransferase n=1 Tax=Limoniibacter endophyticus TaxID=1565040 RepID=A0A8J3DJA2_9HYPH|nr:lipid A biosynthesis lauroyl acyltransferase [Limoniibacter endophyticus]GHC60784.1 lauroyl acyltransferase [Limoniibacter endophyticus]
MASTIGQALRNANYWLIAQAALTVIRGLRLLPADKALNFADGAARKIGPLFGRHRVALDNIRKAFPEKSEQEVQAIASDMWGNMARLGAEYIFLDKLFDFHPDNQKPGRVEVRGIEIFERLAAEKGAPHIFFTGHLGNFELLPVAAATFGLPMTAMFRPPNNPYIARYIMERRNIASGSLLASRSGAALQLARILDEGGNIGALVDQKFMYGIRGTFFGRECETSPLLPKLTRQYDCDVFPARCMRLPGNRFLLELEDKIEMPRDGEGKIDVAASAQMMNDIVERWVREDPGQWMWFHKRWKLSAPKRRKKS